jgi:UPF0755 protein
MSCKFKVLIVLAIFLLLSFVVFLIQIISPADFPIKTIYIVEKNTGLSAISSDLKAKNIIKSEFLFKGFSVLFGGTKGLIAGDYALNERETVLTLAWRMSDGDFDLQPIKITIREGLNIYEIADLLSANLTDFDKAEFLVIAEKEEGYLFPDTYLFLPNISAMEIIKAMKKNFTDQVKTIESQMVSFNRPYSDIIKMASIVEKEAMTVDQKKMVAGILWNRLDQNMPLQVDASFKYINGKVTKDLTLADLKIDSAYNSYLYKGLPPTPISNPGLKSILATINPEKTDYLYFLSDHNFSMYYSKTYNEHLQKKEIYLR